MAVAVAAQMALGGQSRVSLSAPAPALPPPGATGAQSQGRQSSRGGGDREGSGRRAREPTNAAATTIRSARRGATGPPLPPLPAGARCTRCFSQVHEALLCQELQRCRQCLQTGHLSAACPRPRSAAAVVADGVIG
jgi:hypothetical protein